MSTFKERLAELVTDEYLNGHSTQEEIIASLQDEISSFVVTDFLITSYQKGVVRFIRGHGV